MKKVIVVVLALTLVLGLSVVFADGENITITEEFYQEQQN